MIADNEELKKVSPEFAAEQEEMLQDFKKRMSEVWEEKMKNAELRRNAKNNKESKPLPEKEKKEQKKEQIAKLNEQQRKEEEEKRRKADESQYKLPFWEIFTYPGEDEMQANDLRVTRSEVEVEEYEK